MMGHSKVRQNRPRATRQPEHWNIVALKRTTSTKLFGRFRDALMGIEGILEVLCCPTGVRVRHAGMQYRELEGHVRRVENSLISVTA